MVDDIVDSLTSMTIENVADGGQNFEPLRSQHELYAFASMIVASLPFPPLPVLMLQGEDCVDGLASSFDLLQQAIVAQQLGCVPDIAKQNQMALAKQNILAILTTNMSLHNKEAQTRFSDGQAYDDAWVEKAYTLYCSAFRTYFLDNYANSTRDLRFFPMDRVDPNSILLRQGISQCRASHLLSNNLHDAQVIPLLTTNISFTSYKEMIRAYALDLGTLPE